MNKMTPEELNCFSDYVRSYCGMDFSGENLLSLKVSIRERMKNCQLEDTAEYLSQVKGQPAEREKLVALLSVPETYFFRDKKQFDALKETVLPDLLREKSQHSIERPLIKIVSCGCSTGAEPYSIAIAILQSGLHLKADFQIYALDINRDSLEYAKRAIYTKYFFRESNTEFLEDYFEVKGDEYFLRDKVKEMVQFQSANLFDLESSQLSIDHADIIFFRNVQIYFVQKDRNRLLSTFAEKMSPRGYLFLGYSESLMDKQATFEIVESCGAHIWRLRGEGVSDFPEVASPEAAAGEPFTFTAESIPLPDPEPVTSASSIVPPTTFELNESYYEEAMGYMMLKKTNQAEEAFQAQLNKTPNHVESLAGLAQIYADAERDELALETCKRVVALDNLFTGVYFITGLVFYKRSDFEDAKGHFKKAVYCDESHFLARYYLGLTLEAMGEADQARTQYKATIEVIQGFGDEGLRREIAGYSANYILSLCTDSLK